MAKGEFDMKEYDEKLEKRLKDLGDLLRSQPSVTKNGMRTIEQMEQVTQLRSVAFMTPLIKSGLGLAACLLIGAFLWFLIAGPTSITLADVKRAIDLKSWIFIQYEDGAKRWANLGERRSFYTRKDADGGNFYVGMRDHVNGIWRYYHSNWGEQIHEETFTTRPYPQTPWEYAVGDWDDRGIGQFAHKTVEKSTDTIDDRQVVRFDTYNVGPLGLRSLAQQVWADPETRLPIQIRKYSGPKPKKFDTGVFSFPQTGPSSIYDLGAPQGLEVVSNWGVIEPAAKAILGGAKQAQRQFPLSMRIVKKSKYTLSISYRYGNKFRSESYGLTDANHNNLLPIEAPESSDQIHNWASNNLTLFDLCIFDGQYEYSYDSGEEPRNSSERHGATLDVQHHGPDWIDALLPIREHWPYINNVGPMKVLEGQPGIPNGCLLLRWEDESEIRCIRRDWYVDPERDYICVKQLEWRKDEQTEQWVEDNFRQAERTDLTRLQSGQWYARTIKKQEYQPKQIIEFDVKLLTDSEMEHLTGKDYSTGFFDGEKLLKNAMDNGAHVTFWAR
jgi:hypothetical protein